MSAERVGSVSALQERVLHEPAVMERLLLDLSVNVTAMFRDPGFYVVFREKVVPLLRTYPFVRIWNAGCATGEETYSLAILLEEEGIYEKTRIYATDFNQTALEQAREGVFPLERMRDYTRQLHPGGREALLLGVLPAQATTARSSRAPWCGTSCSRSTTSSPTAASTSSR